MGVFFALICLPINAICIKRGPKDIPRPDLIFLSTDIYACYILLKLKTRFARNATQRATEQPLHGRDASLGEGENKHHNALEPEWLRKLLWNDVGVMLHQLWHSFGIALESFRGHVGNILR